MSSVIKAHNVLPVAERPISPVEEPALAALEETNGLDGLSSLETTVKSLLSLAILEYVAARKAHLFLDEARQKAENILKAAEIEKAAAMETAREQGFAAGFEKGRRQAYDESRAEQEKQRQALCKLADGLNSAREDLLKLYFADIVDVAVSLTAKLLKREGGPDAETARALLEEMLPRTSGAKDITVVLNPEDLQLLRSYTDELATLADDQATLLWTEDARVPHGSVIVETERGNLDGTLPVRARRLVEQLLEVVHHGE